MCIHICIHVLAVCVYVYMCKRVDVYMSVVDGCSR